MTEGKLMSFDGAVVFIEGRINPDHGTAGFNERMKGT